MFKDIQAVAFDIDGTLYPSWKLFIRMPFHVIKNFKLYVHFNKTRHVMHKTAPLADFYEYQARILAEISKLKSPRAKEIINEICYDGLKKFFKKVKPYPYVYECIKSMKDAGLKIGILSDFPPEQKGDVWGVRQYCSVVLGTEQLGALKPDPYSFLKMADELGVEPSRILYVGNSLKYDVRGSHNAGMKCAYLLPFWRRIFNKPLKEAEISFSNYRQLLNIVLE